MRFRVHHRVFAAFLGIVGLTMVLVVTLAGRGLRRELTDTFRADLQRQLALAEWIIAEAEAPSPDSLARAITRRIGYRVTLIGTDGEVLGDSYVDPGLIDSVENHGDRPEVMGALAGEESFSQRTSTTVGTRLLYGARLTTLGGEPVVLRIAAPLTDVDRAVDGVRRAVVLAGLVAMLLSLAVAYLTSTALSRPLVQLAEQARALASGGVSGRAPRHTGVPELDDLALAINRLTEELEARLGELGRERDGMQTLIDCMAEGVIALTEDARILRINRAARELVGLPEALRFAPIGAVVHHPELRAVLEESVVAPIEARDVSLRGRHFVVTARPLDVGGAVTTLLDVSELRRLEQVRRDFVANASHELKTPLTAIHGFAETLLDDDPPETLRDEFLGSIRKNTLRLQRLVDDLLDLSRLESGGWVARPEEVAVPEVAHDAWEPYAAGAEEKGVAFVVDAPVRVSCDRGALLQILQNLLENALRHTDPGGRIEVRGRRGGPDRVVLEVVDDGEGIPSRSLPRIFERFYRADSSRARDHGGTGLGLAIVRHLAGAMGGTAEAESALGKGTTIRLELPSA